MSSPQAIGAAEASDEGTRAVRLLQAGSRLQQVYPLATRFLSLWELSRGFWLSMVGRSKPGVCVLNEILDILNRLRGRIENQIKEFDRGTIVVVSGAGGPIVANSVYDEMLHAQLLEVNEVMTLLDAAGAARGIFAAT